MYVLTVGFQAPVSIRGEFGTDADDVAWSSSNDSVLTVEGKGHSAIVRGVGPGAAEVQATVGDGEDAAVLATDFRVVDPNPKGAAIVVDGQPELVVGTSERQAYAGTSAPTIGTVDNPAPPPIRQRTREQAETERARQQDRRARRAE